MRLIWFRPAVVTASFALLAMVAFAGCYSYRTVRVTVLDAETGRPIPGALVKTDYQTGIAHVPPATSRGVTGAAGTATLRVAKDPLGIFIVPSADGYLDYWADGAFPDGQPCNRPHTELPAWPFDAVTLTLYAEPPRRSSWSCLTNIGGSFRSSAATEGAATRSRGDGSLKWSGSRARHRRRNQVTRGRRGT